jgi:hypothetical protein
MKHLELFENFTVGETKYIYHKDGWILGVKDSKIKKVEDFNIIKDMKMIITDDEEKYDEIQNYLISEPEFRLSVNSWSGVFVENEENKKPDPEWERRIQMGILPKGSTPPLNNIAIKFEDKLMTKPGSIKSKEEYLSQYNDLKGFTKTKVFIGMMSGDLNI